MKQQTENYLRTEGLKSYVLVGQLYIKTKLCKRKKKEIARQRHFL